MQKYPPDSFTRSPVHPFTLTSDGNDFKYEEAC